MQYPFINANAGTENELPIPSEYLWDFTKNRFVYENGKNVIVYGNEAIKIWIYKALMTERFVYLAYSWQYGIELKPFIGKVMHVDERFSEIKRIIIECLMVNPYIFSIDSITHEAKGDKVHIIIALTTIYGRLTLDV